MIRTAHIRNFKGFDDLTVEGLGRVTIIGGGNNTGKTSLMEALFLSIDRENANSFIAQLGRRGMAEVPLTVDGIWRPYFTDFKMDKNILISYSLQETGDVSLKIELDTSTSKVTTKIYGQNAENIATTIQAVRGAIIMHYTREGKNQTIKQTITDGGLSSIADIPESLPEAIHFFSSRNFANPDEEIANFTAMDKLDRTEKVVSLLKTSIEPRLEGLSILGHANKSLLHVKLKGLEKCPIGYMGDGMARLASIAIVMASGKHSIVFVDEIENGIHYKALPKVWLGLMKAAKEFNCQIFATTHSYECLQAAVESIQNEEQDIKDELRFVRLQRNSETNKIESRSYDYEMLLSGIENNLEFR